MEKVVNVQSVFDNGEVWPHGTPVFPEILLRGGTHMVLKRWMYAKNQYQLKMDGRNSFGVVDLLPDQTGFLTMKHYDVPEANILNGDTSVRFVLKPVFNVRGHDANRLALVQKFDQEAAQRAGLPAVSRQNQTLFHNKTERTDVLEMFGDDGFGDCYYEYDSNTGQLLRARALPYRS